LFCLSQRRAFEKTNDVVLWSVALFFHLSRAPLIVVIVVVIIIDASAFIIVLLRASLAKQRHSIQHSEEQKAHRENEREHTQGGNFFLTATSIPKNFQKKFLHTTFKAGARANLKLKLTNSPQVTTLTLWVRFCFEGRGAQINSNYHRKGRAT